MMSWSGNHGAAVRITTEVVRNAVAHVDTGVVELPLSVDEEDVLLIDVTDPYPGHEGLDEALAGGDGTGLWLVRHLGGEVNWFPAASGHGKTIRVRMRPSSEIGCATTAVDAS
jgi:anti-sigma regulatory factor (Ser/Thr protein kinase)